MLVCQSCACPCGSCPWNRLLNSLGLQYFTCLLLVELLHRLNFVPKFISANDKLKALYEVVSLPGMPEDFVIDKTDQLSRCLIYSVKETIIRAFHLATSFHDPLPYLEWFSWSRSALNFNINVARNRKISPRNPFTWCPWPQDEALLRIVYHIEYAHHCVSLCILLVTLFKG